MIRLLFLLLLGEAWAQETISFEFGFRGAIPEVFTDDLTMERGGAVVSVNQRALPQRDYQPFPWVSPGFAINVLFNRNKFSWGVGYEFQYDYYSFPPRFVRQGVEAFSAKIQNNIFYGQVRFHFRNNFRNGFFIGAKAGFMLTFEGFSDYLEGTLNSLGVDQGRKFHVIRADHFSPGLYIAFQIGLKLYFLKNPKYRYKPGISIIAEIAGATPTRTVSRQGLSEDQSRIVGREGSVRYRSNYSHLGINLILFGEITRRPRRDKRRDEIDPPYLREDEK